MMKKNAQYYMMAYSCTIKCSEHTNEIIQNIYLSLLMSLITSFVLEWIYGTEFSTELLMNSLSLISNDLFWFICIILAYNRQHFRKFNKPIKFFGVEAFVDEVTGIVDSDSTELAATVEDVLVLTTTVFATLVTVASSGIHFILANIDSVLCKDYVYLWTKGRAHLLQWHSLSLFPLFECSSQF